MGTCRYQYTASELYQRTPPGCGPESCCGAATYPAQDEPELTLARGPNGEPLMVATGRLVNREQDDPHCPAHGGCPEPLPLLVTVLDIQRAREAYAALVTRFDGQAALPAAGQRPADPRSPSVSEVQAAGERVGALIGAFNGEHMAAIESEAP